MKLSTLFILVILMALPALAQIPTPQLNLTGNIGCQGFPCFNTGQLIMASDANHAMTAQESSAQSPGLMNVTSSVDLTATRNLIAPSGKFSFTIKNATTGGQAIQIIGPSGMGVIIPNGQTVSAASDGTNYVLVGGGVPSVNGIPTAVSIVGSGGTTVNTVGSTISISSAAPVSQSVTFASSDPTNVPNPTCHSGFTCTNLGGVFDVTVSGSSLDPHITLSWEAAISGVFCRASNWGVSGGSPFVQYYTSFSPVFSGTSWQINMGNLSAGNVATMEYTCSFQ